MKNKGKTCSHCDKPALVKGYCKFHYNRWRSGVPLDAPKNVRKIADIKNQRFNYLVAISPTSGRCPYTGSVIWKCICDCGAVLDVSVHALKQGIRKSCGCSRNKSVGPNPVSFKNDRAYLTTFNKNGEITAKFFVDEADYDKIKHIRWYFINGYVRGTLKGGKKVYLHRFLIGGDSDHIDHANRNSLDNTRANLRPATYTENFGNRVKHKTYAGKATLSKYKGVSKNAQGWYASICYDGKDYRLSNFKTEIEAAKQYNKWAEELFGEFSNINEI